MTEEFKDLGLGFVLEEVESWQNIREDIVRVFETTWYEGLIESAFSERPNLRNFDQVIHEHNLKRFRELDKFLLEYNRMQLAEKHWGNLPSLSYGGELTTIKTEINKRRRHKPIRKLIMDAGRAIQAIKPVFMMSPMSVAKYLPPGLVEFDLVVFDEASQVKPVDALGAILRGNQVIVVGDHKQLPPTSFFELLTENIDEDYEYVVSDIESILNLFLAQNAHSCMLKWHYRSRNDSLIAVSNNEFYNNSLVCFPCPGTNPISEGLVFHQISDSYYDRGGSRSNLGEAKIVAKAILRHADENPDLTLGVAAFSSAQRDAIINHLELLRRQDNSHEDYFNSHSHEPFFVKNLENVQGDERDIVLISVGYGKTKEGLISLNFGPLNNEGGERRLNVLITRARYSCHVYANFTAADIDTRRTKSRGMIALKNFLTYAKDRTLYSPYSTGLEPESPFELEVLRVLGQSGYQVEPQVGAAGFRIDIGVIDENKPGRYLLGIECDGASYHSARSARDRDRLRQEVLEGLGWRLHRIWSTDWLRNPDRELGRVVESIEKARVYWAGIDSEEATKCSSRRPPPSVIERTHETKQDKNEFFLEPYQEAEIAIILRGQELHEISPREMAIFISQIVNLEGPVHKDIVLRRITHGAGLKRAGNRIRSAFLKGIKRALRDEMFEKDKHEFLWKEGKKPPIARDRSN
ncbi:DUF3320 domain-containing protein, partial [Acidobacteriota bacterium]